MDRADTVVRAFELPLRGCLVETWPLLRECWQQAASLANWCVVELAKRDVTRTPKMATLPPFVDVDLYAMAFGRAMPKPGRKDKVLPKVKASYDSRDFWAGARISAVQVMRQVKQDYLRSRLKVFWLRKQALKTYRSFPWPVHAQQWKAAGFDDAGKPWIDVALPGGTVRLNLRGGPEFGRQMGHFRDVVKGDLPRLALSIHEQTCSTGCHRPYGIEKPPGGGQDTAKRVMVKMVAHLPVREKPGERVLILSHDPHAFWVAELTDTDATGEPINVRPAWVLNADHVKRVFEWQAVHEARLQRFAQDTKAERRLSKRRLQQLNESRRRCCDKHDNRIDSWLHEVTANLIGFAIRQRVGTVIYRDREQSFIPRFPWYTLRERLKDKLKHAGIGCRCQMNDGEDEVSVIEVA